MKNLIEKIFGKFQSKKSVEREMPLEEITVNREEVLKRVKKALLMDNRTPYRMTGNSLDEKSIEKIFEDLEKQYEEQVEVWKFYNLAKENKEKPGTYFYEGSYDGSKEASGKGENFANMKFQLPTFHEVVRKFTKKEVKLYKEMLEQGLEPQLQITPIAMNIRDLAKKIDAKREDLKINKNDTYISRKMKDEELQYAPTSVRAIQNGKRIEIRGGKGKSEWIKENKGYLIDIVPMKRDLEADESIQKDKKSGKVNYNAVQAENYFQKLKKAGLVSMGFESYLLAQMRALKAGKPIETDTGTLLLDSGLTDSQFLAVGRWGVAGVLLDGSDADGQFVALRCRGAARVM